MKNANPATADLTPLGTTKQAGLLTRLAQNLEFPTVDAALASIQLSKPLSVEEASKAISALLPLWDAKKGATPDQAVESKPKFLTARILRRIDAGEVSQPVPLDDDAAWVLLRLAKLRDVERALGDTPGWAGVNNGQAIEVKHLVAYFGSLEAVASVFAVSVGTVKGWGTFVPPNRIHEAQVRTKGYVQA